MYCKYEYFEVLSRITKNDSGRVSILFPEGLGALGRPEEEAVGRMNQEVVKAPKLT